MLNTWAAAYAQHNVGNRMGCQSQGPFRVGVVTLLPTLKTLTHGYATVLFGAITMRLIF